jgi:hypothetical protein
MGNFKWGTRWYDLLSAMALRSVSETLCGIAAHPRWRGRIAARDDIDDCDFAVDCYDSEEISSGIQLDIGSNTLTSVRLCHYLGFKHPGQYISILNSGIQLDIDSPYQKFPDFDGELPCFVGEFPYFRRK